MEMAQRHSAIQPPTLSWEMPETTLLLVVTKVIRFTAARTMILCSVDFVSTQSRAGAEMITYTAMGTMTFSRVTRSASQERTTFTARAVTIPWTVAEATTRLLAIRVPVFLISPME